MELVDDEDVETMQPKCTDSVFAELAGIETTEDPTSLGEEDRAQELCMVVSISYVDSQLTIHEIDIDLNAAPETDVVGDDVYHSSDPSYHEVDSESDPDVDEVPDDIDDEGVNDDRNVNSSSVGNQIRRIVIHNNPGAFQCAIAANFQRDYKNADWKKQVVRMAHELEPHIFRQRITRLESDMEGQTNIYFRQWLGTMEPWQ
ncbi:hypothetical protein GOBAR_AA04983 [Gossypium barbadense]|uniref:Uncharacterized protein n=1 Tax=Gossypium barbadense TaxID=3634 RepID=A0A2P5YJ13_GOSBA|nr:hypothetical protein GOBAR_AA04983 [Gossypium barbadense]